MKNIALTILFFAFTINMAFAKNSCEQLSLDLTKINKSAVERAITKQTDFKEINVLNIFHKENWLFIYVDSSSSDSFVLFYSANPEYYKYTSIWSGAAPKTERLKLKAWALSNNQGIPLELASCFSFFVTNRK